MKYEIRKGTHKPCELWYLGEYQDAASVTEDGQYVDVKIWHPPHMICEGTHSYCAGFMGSDVIT